MRLLRKLKQWLNKLNPLAYIDCKRLEQMREARDAYWYIKWDYEALERRYKWAIENIPVGYDRALHNHDPRKCFECKAKPKVRKRKLESILKKAAKGKVLTSEEILIFNESRKDGRTV